jgi:hypothetical protein
MKKETIEHFEKEIVEPPINKLFQKTNSNYIVFPLLNIYIYFRSVRYQISFSEHIMNFDINCSVGKKY